MKISNKFCLFVFGIIIYVAAALGLSAQPPDGDAELIVLNVKVEAYSCAAFRRHARSGAEAIYRADIMRCKVVSLGKYEGRRLDLIIETMDRPRRVEDIIQASIEISRISLDGPFLDDPNYYPTYSARILSLVWKNEPTGRHTKK